MSPRLLEIGIGSSVFHQLADGYKRDGGSKMRSRFTTFFGDFVEDYVAGTLEETVVVSAGLERTQFRRVKADPPKPVFGY